MPPNPKPRFTAIPWLCAVLVGGSIVLWVARWAAFPVALDPAYHLLIVEQMREAGGVLCWDAWQYAPVGRPHLYPPALHLILLALTKIGLPSLTAVRLLTALLIPGVILAVGRLGRELGGSRAGWLTAATAALTWPLLRHAATALAGALGAIELCVLLIAAHRGRWLAAAAALALLHYTHLGLPVIAWTALALLALVVPESRRTIGRAAALGLALAAPWLLHLLRHRASLQLLRLAENEQLTWMAGLWALAFVPRCSNRVRPFLIEKGQTLFQAWRWGLVFLMAFVPLALRYPYRWVQGEGLLPVVLLAGLGLAAMTAWLEQRGLTPWWSAAAALLAAAGALSLSVTWTPRRTWIEWRTPGIVRLADLRSTTGDLDAGIYGPLMTELGRTIEQATQPGEIVWSNLPYGVGAAAALARRPLSTAMLQDVKPAETFDPLSAAQLIVWFHVERWPGLPDLQEVVQRYRLEPVAEASLARLYRNPAAAVLAESPRACVPFGLAFMLLCGLVLCMIVDLRS